MMLFLQFSYLHKFLLGGRKIHPCSSYKVRRIWGLIVYQVKGLEAQCCNLNRVFVVWVLDSSCDFC